MSDCGKIMVGSGDDTYDPICELPAGHDPPCMSSAAIDQHKLAEKGGLDLSYQDVEFEAWSNWTPETTPDKRDVHCHGFDAGVKYAEEHPVGESGDRLTLVFKRLTEDERQLLTCALAGNHPPRLNDLRIPVLRGLAKARHA